MDDLNFIFKRNSYSFYLKTLENGLNKWIRKKTYNCEEMDLLYLKNNLTANDIVFAFKIGLGEAYMEPGSIVMLPKYPKPYPEPRIIYNVPIPQDWEDMKKLLKEKSERDSKIFGTNRVYLY